MTRRFRAYRVQQRVSPVLVLVEQFHWFGRNEPVVGSHAQETGTKSEQQHHAAFYMDTITSISLKTGSR